MAVQSRLRPKTFSPRSPVWAVLSQKLACNYIPGEDGEEVTISVNVYSASVMDRLN